MAQHGIRARLVAAGAALSITCSAHAGFTNNIMLTGYWPPTNEMVRQFSNSDSQNDGGWQGVNWEGRGYDIYSFFPEFPGGGLGKGEGDLEVDYQDTSADFWRIVDEVKPVAIITFSRGSGFRTWEVETQQRNLEVWLDDFEAPFQPTPSPPDASVPAGHIRYSTLPVDAIADAVNSAGLNVNAFVDDDGFGGGFLSEFIAYHGAWYQSLHADPSDPYWTVAAGHIHVSGSVRLESAIAATEVTLRTLTDYLDTVVPAPATVGLLAFGGLGVLGRGRTRPIRA